MNTKVQLSWKSNSVLGTCGKNWVAAPIIFGKMHFLLISENGFFREIKCNGMTSFVEFMSDVWSVHCGFFCVAQMMCVWDCHFVVWEHVPLWKYLIIVTWTGSRETWGRRWACERLRLWVVRSYLRPGQRSLQCNNDMSSLWPSRYKVPLSHEVLMFV